MKRSKPGTKRTAIARSRSSQAEAQDFAEIVEREFYLRLAVQERWSSRDLERQMNAALFERTILSPPKVSALLTQLHPGAEAIFKDLLCLAPEARRKLAGDAITGKRRAMSSRPEGTLDSNACPALLPERGSNGATVPAVLPQANFRRASSAEESCAYNWQPIVSTLVTRLHPDAETDFKNTHLSRALSPAFIDDYQTKLPDKKLLRAKLHEFYELSRAAVAETLPLPKAGKRKPKGSKG